MRLRGVLVLAAWLAGPIPASRAGDLAADVLQRLSQVSSRRAGFTEEKQLAALTTVLRSSGLLIFAGPGYLEKRTLAPRPERLVIDGGRLTIQEGTGPAHALDIDSHPALRALVDIIRAPLVGDIATLKRSYQIQAEGDAGGWRLTLLPSGPEIGRYVASVTLDGANNVLRVIRVVQPNGDMDTTTIAAAP